MIRRLGIGCSTSASRPWRATSPTYRAGWFSRFHESLAPTDDERAARVDAYLGLLRSRVGPTVSLAVAALGRVQAAGRLPADDLLDRIGPVLVDGSAGTAKAALGLVRRAATEGSAVDARRAAMVAAEALANGSPEVQRAAIELIGRLSAARDEAVARAVAERCRGSRRRNDLPQRPCSRASVAKARSACCQRRPRQGPLHRPRRGRHGPTTTAATARPVDPPRRGRHRSIPTARSSPSTRSTRSWTSPSRSSRPANRPTTSSASSTPSGGWAANVPMASGG